MTGLCLPRLLLVFYARYLEAQHVVQTALVIVPEETPTLSCTALLGDHSIS